MKSASNRLTIAYVAKGKKQLDVDKNQKVALLAEKIWKHHSRRELKKLNK